MPASAVMMLRSRGVSTLRQRPPRNPRHFGLGALGDMAEDKKAIVDSGLFDTAFYLQRNPDVAADPGYGNVKDPNYGPIQHYLDWGWKEGRDPSALFSTRWYLDTYKDVAAANVNPLVHFVRYGFNEGRSANPQMLAAKNAPAVPVPNISIPADLLPGIHDKTTTPALPSVPVTAKAAEITPMAVPAAALAGKAKLLLYGGGALVLVLVLLRRRGSGPAAVMVTTPAAVHGYGGRPRRRRRARRRS